MKAIILTKDPEFEAKVSQLDQGDLPKADVLVDVEHSTLNYKDALAITNSGPVVRSYPMVPGIDFVGTVRRSDSDRFAVGDRVLLNGWGVGENHWGGLAQSACVHGDWLIQMPESLSSKQTMEIGTAGYTAMLCIQALERFGVKPADGPVLVTGAAGGVGSFATYFLSKKGFEVHASTGRSNETEYLRQLGATEIVDRATLSSAGKPLQRERWAAAVDSVGSHTLANVCASIKADGAVAACGMAQGLDLPGSVAPFILRGIALFGINSVTRPIHEREGAWAEIAHLLDGQIPGDITKTIGLGDVIPTAAEIIKGNLRGRVVVDVNK